MATQVGDNLVIQRRAQLTRRQIDAMSSEAKSDEIEIQQAEIRKLYGTIRALQTDNGLLARANRRIVFKSHRKQKSVRGVHS